MFGHPREIVADIRTDLQKWRLAWIGPRPRMWHLSQRVVRPHRWDGPHRLCMGSCGPDGTFDPETALFRRYHPRLRHQLGQPHKDASVPIQMIDQAIYAGPLLPAYGHFLLESLARLWAAPSFPHHPIVWTVNSAQSCDHLLPWMRESLDLLGINNTVRLIREATLIEQLIVPSPGFEIQYRFGRHHSKFLARLDWRPIQDRKLWVSRSGIDPDIRQGQKMLEAALAADGWTIIHPETLSLTEQLQEFSSAARIAGEQGSALHSVIFLRPAPGLRLDVFARDPTLNGHAINANQETISARRRIDYRFHKIPGERVVGRKGSRVSKHYAPPDHYMACLAQA